MTENKLSLNDSFDDLENKIMSETNAQDLQKLIDVFNINIKKKDIIRSGKLSELQDKVTQNMIQRIENGADGLSDRDLLDYFKAIQENLNKTTDKPAEIKSIQLTQNQINVNMTEDQFTRDSRRKIAAAVEALLNRNKEEENIIITPEEEEND